MIIWKAKEADEEMRNLNCPPIEKGDRARQVPTGDEFGNFVPPSNSRSRKIEFIMIASSGSAGGCEKWEQRNTQICVTTIIRYYLNTHSV